jgi:hypothetical protein
MIFKIISLALVQAHDPYAVQQLSDKLEPHGPEINRKGSRKITESTHDWMRSKCTVRYRSFKDQVCKYTYYTNKLLGCGKDKPKDNCRAPQKEEDDGLDKRYPLPKLGAKHITMAGFSAGAIKTASLFNFFPWL